MKQGRQAGIRHAVAVLQAEVCQARQAAAQAGDRGIGEAIAAQQVHLLQLWQAVNQAAHSLHPEPPPLEKLYSMHAWQGPAAQACCRQMSNMLGGPAATHAHRHAR